jgi:chromate reductase, NAD(P)H dehydrogenase (quinone)
MVLRARSPLRVLVFPASLRKASFNGQLARLAAETVDAQGGLVDRAAMSDCDCPSYDQDIETSTGIPEGAQEFCRRLEAADAFVVASPEYNASIPGALKNLIDWTSRVRPQPFNGKQGLLMSASPSMSGGNRGLWALRVPFEHLGARIYPEMFSLAQSHEAFDERGRLVDAVLQKRFDETIDCFLDLVEAVLHYPALKTQWVEFLGEHPSRVIDRVETVDGATGRSRIVRRKARASS